MGIDAINVPAPPSPPSANYVVLSQKPSTQQPPAKAALPRSPVAPGAPTSCLSDDIAMRAIPARKTDDLDYLGKSYTKATAWFPGGAIPRGGTQAISYIYGACFFEDAARALATVTSPDHRIYIAGWSTDLRVQLKSGAGGTLEEQLKNSRAQVRGLLWEGSAGSGVIRVRSVNNSGTVQAIQSLPNGAAVLDSHLPPLGGHHQKMLIVQGDAGLIAFIGGMDFMPNRVDVAPDRGEPWSDVQLRLVGPAADDVRLVFEQRWIDHPATRPLDEKLGLSSTASSEQRRAFAFPAPRPPSARAFETVTSAADSPRQAQRQAIAVGRTFGRAMKGDPPVYSFAPNGDYSAWSLIEAGIQRAVRWIYVEDQYLVSRMGRQALLAKLKEPNFEFLLMLMSNTGSVGGEFKYLATARNEFRRDLLALDPQKKKWGLYTLVKPPDPARQAWCGSFVHSKTWIFDDGYAIVGSANFDDRGYTLDSEVVAGVSQSNDIDLWVGKTFAIDLRTRLWAKYLGLPHAMVSHFRKGLTHWKSPPPGAMVYESSEYDDDPLYNPPSHFPPNADAKAKYEMIWKMFADPDAR